MAGAAKGTVMLWNAEYFESESGGYLFLQRPSAAALVCRPLPDANAALDKYLSDFRRRDMETMGQFITRESVVHDEFREAVERLLDHGLDPAAAGEEVPKEKTFPGGKEDEAKKKPYRLTKFLDIVRG